ncbi:hypothetical protein GGS21DRAFT_492490 [Xylaria nigripes]|nr:hypothetical protein GGS21DRAFT_492490 [Xylaria nigripes]
MHLYSWIATIIIALGLSLSQARIIPLLCYSFGAQWGDYNRDAIGYAAEACNYTFGNRRYDQYQRVRVCRSFNINLRLDMDVELLTYPPRDLSVEECYLRFWKIVNCPRGGTYKDRNWHYS